MWSLAGNMDIGIQGQQTVQKWRSLGERTCNRGKNMGSMGSSDAVKTEVLTALHSGVSRMAYPRGANRGRGFGAPGQIEEWRPPAEVLDGGRGRGLDARTDYFFFR